MPDPTPLEPEDLAAMVSYQVRLLQIAAYKTFESKTKGYGSAPRYFGLLRIIQSNPGLHQSRLAEAVCLDRSSLVPILETLTAEGLIERRPSETDKRVRCVYMTGAGAALLADLARKVDQHEAELVAPLTEAERETLSHLLRRVAEHARAGLTASGSFDGAA